MCCKKGFFRKHAVFCSLKLTLYSQLQSLMFESEQLNVCSMELNVTSSDMKEKLLKDSFLVLH